jgi:phosphoribosyl-ATP pyrophosphohydrolase
MSANILEKLAATIAERAGGDTSTSYSAKLLSAGIEKCAKKFGEEAVELAMAAVQKDKTHITAEAADVLYHLLVVLKAADVPLTDVFTELQRREAQSGLQEKASRGAKS